MKTKSFGLLALSFVMFAAITATSIPTAGSQDFDAATISNQARADQPAPIVVAQGRCFNGKCY